MNLIKIVWVWKIVVLSRCVGVFYGKSGAGYVNSHRRYIKINDIVYPFFDRESLESAYTSAYKADKYSTGNIRFSWQTAGEHKPYEKNFFTERYTNQIKNEENSAKDFYKSKRKFARVIYRDTSLIRWSFMKKKSLNMMSMRE